MSKKVFLLVLFKIIFYLLLGNLIGLIIFSPDSLYSKSQINCSKLILNLPETNQIFKEEYDFNKIEEILKEKNFNPKYGGKWKPNDCDSEYFIAILVSYKNRLSNLKIFLLNIHPFLIRHKINYGLYLIEPKENIKFNKGILYNSGFIEVLKEPGNKWNCIFFHDVDMLPESNLNYYRCDPSSPVHFSVTRNIYNYTRQNGYYGGVYAFLPNQYLKVNGFSTSYFKWGLEDDDMRERTLRVFKKLNRPPHHIGKYWVGSHSRDHIDMEDYYKRRKNFTKITKLNIHKYGFREGLSTTKYKLLNVEKTGLFTKFLIEYDDRKFSSK